MAEQRVETPSGIPIKEVYGPDDIKDLDHVRDLGNPGGYPFTRGIHPQMYRGQMWTRRFQVGFGTPQDTNERLKFVQREGATAFTWTLDQPSTHGFDADHPLAEGCVGITGTSISTLEDVEATFSGFSPTETSVTLSMGNIVEAPFLALYTAFAEKLGLPLDKVLGTIQVDPIFILGHGFRSILGHFMPPDLILRLAVDNVEFCSKNLPKMNWLAANGYSFRDSVGVSAVQEAAFSLAAAFFLLEKGLERGLDIDQFAGRAAFLNSCHIDFFEEIAKFRAMRRIWARTLKERFGAKNPRSMWFRTAVQTAGSSYTTQQPFNNIVRGTIEFLSGIFSGLQSFMVASYDEGISLPTEESSQMSLRIQQIIGLETGVAKVVDPLGGSYFIESLTTEMEEEINKLLAEIERRGGIWKVFTDGWIESEVNKAQFK